MPGPRNSAAQEEKALDYTFLMGRVLYLYRKGSKLAVLWRSTGPIAFRNPIGNHLVPLVLALSLEQSYNDDSHVVAADATSVAVRC
jgi:hypothetical protein